MALYLPYRCHTRRERRGSLPGASALSRLNDHIALSFLPSLQDLTSLCSSSKELANVLSGQVSQLWLPDRLAMGIAGLSANSSIPKGAECLLVQQVTTAEKQSGFLMLFSERPR